MTEPESRYELVSRRAILKRSLILCTVVAVPGLACSSGSGDKLTTATTTTKAGAATAPTTTKAAAATGATGTTTTAAKTTGAPGSTPAVASGPALPDSAQLKIDFTYAASAAGGRVNNPYVAVWLEDASGALVRTVAIWYKARESKYLQEMRRWYTANRAAVAQGSPDGTTTASGATRLPGAYSLVWDGKTDAGARAAQGEYFVCIEAAREHGPYELIRESIKLGTAKLDKALTPTGELTAAAVSFVV